jgi:hypothetical protein
LHRVFFEAPGSFAVLCSSGAASDDLLVHEKCRYAGSELYYFASLLDRIKYHQFRYRKQQEQQDSTCRSVSLRNRRFDEADIHRSRHNPFQLLARSRQRKFTQVVDFETAHELFKALFCVLLKASEYERSINSLQFDQSLAIRAARITGHAEITALAGNTFPMFLVGPLHLSQRFVLHGLFTEHLHEYLLRLKDEQSRLSACTQ